MLDEPESKHAIRVLRLETGDRVVLVDGKGGWYNAVIHDDHPKRCLLLIESFEKDYAPLDYGLHVAVSPTKNMDRFEWFLEKATEIGITEITPLMTQRSERKQVKPDRLERILVSAMKQSLKAYKPVLHEACTLENFLSVDRPGVKGIAHCYPLDRLGVGDLIGEGPYTLLIGPEGDFTEQEVGRARAAGYLAFHMGESRLRTETAALYATAAISLLHK